MYIFVNKIGHTQTIKNTIAVDKCWLKTVKNSIFDCKLLPVSENLQLKMLFLKVYDPCLLTALLILIAYSMIDCKIDFDCLFNALMHQIVAELRCRLAPLLIVARHHANMPV